jgi:hypothetical protein
MKEKPKKERRFLKAIGRVGEILIQEVLIKIGSNLIKKIGGKKTLPSILFLLASLSLFAQYPNTGNKQRLGFQTTGDGLTWRGSESDTASIQPINNQNAWVILDTVNLKFYSFDFTSNVWNSVGGAAFTQPVDSLFFNVNVPTNNVDTAKMRWDSDLATVVLGLNDNVPNELGFKNFWLVKNQTGATITKGSLVYANGTVGASGRITIDKFIADGSIDAKYLLGITAHDLTDGTDGYVISFGKIRKVNTDTFAAGAILYPSPTVAGVWTDVEPIAPNIDMPIGFCINSHANNGTIAIRVASGYKLNELHDVAISSPVENSSLYYKGGLWRDTTATLLVSDTTSMLTNYLRSGTAASTYLPLTGGTMTGTINRQEGSNDGSANTFYYNILNYFAKRDNAKVNQTAQITFTDRPGTSTFPNNVRTSDIYLMTAKNFSGGQLGQYLDTTLSIVANQDGGRVGISKLNPAYKLDVNGTFNASGNSLFGGSLGITGATTLSSTLNVTGISTLLNKTFIGNFTDNTPTSGTNFNIRLESDNVSSIGFYDADNTIANIKFSAATGFVIGAFDGTFGPHSTTIAGETTLSAPLTVNSSAVFNEGSAIADFRVESDGNINMLFVDGTNNRVGIGTNAPTKTLEVNGEVKIATVTATPTSLLGKDGSNVVGEVTDINQSGVMKVEGTTATTNSVGGINVAHGLSYTPSKVIATIAQLNSYVIVIRGITSTNLEFTVYDSTTGVGLDTVSVGFYWIAFK